MLDKNPNLNLERIIFSLLYLMNNKSIYFFRMEKIIRPIKKINQRAWQRML